MDSGNGKKFGNLKSSSRHTSAIVCSVVWGSNAHKLGSLGTSSSTPCVPRSSGTCFWAPSPLVSLEPSCTTYHGMPPTGECSFLSQWCKGVRSSNIPIGNEEVKQILIEGHGVPPASGGLVGIMSAFVLHLHPIHLFLALHPVPVMALSPHLFINHLKQLTAALPIAELLLDLLLAPEECVISMTVQFCTLGYVLKKHKTNFSMVYGSAHGVLVGEDIGG